MSSVHKTNHYIYDESKGSRYHVQMVIWVFNKREFYKWWSSWRKLIMVGELPLGSTSEGSREKLLEPKSVVLRGLCIHCPTYGLAKKELSDRSTFILELTLWLQYVTIIYWRLEVNLEYLSGAAQLVCWDKVSHWPWTHHIGWAAWLVTGRDPPMSESPMLGLQVLTTMPSSFKHGFWGSNSGSHYSTSLSELSTQPQLH